MKIQDLVRALELVREIEPLEKALFRLRANRPIGVSVVMSPSQQDVVIEHPSQAIRKAIATEIAELVAAGRAELVEMGFELEDTDHIR